MSSRNLSRSDAKTSVTSSLLLDQGVRGRMLVVGCGDGREAGVLARELKVDVVGIDVGEEFEFDFEGSAPAVLKTMDAQRLEFEDASFDAVYSFHALEHIPDPRLAVREMRRILKPGGVFVVGTPNKSRLIGYIGSASPIGDRIRWNLADWRARLGGRWSNEQGAHAGFTISELISMCSELGVAQDVSDDYYRRLYPSHEFLMSTLRRTGLRRWAYPAVYVAGRVA